MSIIMANEGGESVLQALGGFKKMGLKGFFESKGGFTVTDVRGELVPESGGVEPEGPVAYGFGSSSWNS
jgi:hypothetical protein